MSTQIDRLTELAKEDPKRQFYSIAHMITPEALYAAFRGLRKKASAGVDGVTYGMYERDAVLEAQQLLYPAEYSFPDLTRSEACRGPTLQSTWRRLEPRQCTIYEGSLVILQDAVP
jgi:hypothetical protein